MVRNLVIIEETQVTVKSTRLSRVDWLVMFGLVAMTLAVYARTLAPDVLPGDAGEFQFAAWRLGLAHPTGYPLYLLLGSLWQHLLALFDVSPAAALNGLSALFAALAVAVLYLFMLDVPVVSPVTRRLVAIFAGLLLVVNVTFWSQALIAEVYTLHTLLLLALLLALHRAAVPSPAADGTSVVVRRRLVWAALLFGLSMTHHAMTLLAAPGILIYLWTADRDWWRFSRRTWLAMVAALLLPLTLYAYIPLRSGPAASPWHHQRLGDTTLSLYQNNWTSFVSFLTGQSISVGFYGAGQAFASIPQAGTLWLHHFGWLGLVLMALGIYVLAVNRRPLLWLTAGIAAAQQVFNLFYAIGDIGVYYIPLYVIGAIWAGYGVAGLAEGMWLRGTSASQSSSRIASVRPLLGMGIMLLLFLAPLTALRQTSRLVDQSVNLGARSMWEEILAALPAGDSILVSNDRDEVPPLFYLQYVEGRAPGTTALHPLMAPDARFSDIGATIDTALREGDGTSVYLIKEMPGLEIKYELGHENPPLVRVQNRTDAAPGIPVEQPLDGLSLLGYDWEPSGGDILVRLHWLVNEPQGADYITSVQLFDAAGSRLAQSDHPPGGVYYPTSLWKPGERLVEEHLLTPEAPLPADGAILQIGMYTGPSFEQLADPLRFQVSFTAAE